MSGGGLWKIDFNINNDTINITNILLFGVATEEVTENYKATKLLCRGPISIYKVFYKYALSQLQ